MKVYDMLVDERRRIADLLDSLSDEQWRRQSLCDAWTVHDVAAHLVTFLRFGQAKIYYCVVLRGADFDRFNVELTRREARRDRAEIIARLRRWADSRTTIPRSGFDPVLADVVLHDLDVRRPLGLPREVREDRWSVTFNHLVKQPALGYGMGSRLQGLRVETTDTGWAHGSGPLVRGTAESVLLGISGRAIGPDELEGDGVPLLARRVEAPPRAGTARRLGRAAKVIVNPPPADRRSRSAAGV